MMTQAYKDGKQAFLDGKDVDANPHKHPSSEWVYWWDGWQDARGATISEAYKEGKAAFNSGQGEEVNTYQCGTPEYTHWWDGWTEASLSFIDTFQP